VHRGTGTQTNVADGTQIDQSLHGEENVLCADTGYTGAEKLLSMLAAKCLGWWKPGAALTKRRGGRPITLAAPALAC
jgi:IS5 family transposase